MEAKNISISGDKRQEVISQSPVNFFINSRRRLLQPRLDSPSKSAEIAHALHFVVRQFNAKVMLEPRQHLQRLKAVNAKFLEEIIGWREGFPPHPKMLRREVQHFVCGLIYRPHCRPL